MSLPLLLSDMTQVNDCSTFNGQELQTLAKVFWPGPLTLILPDVLEHMNELLTQNGTVAVRSPDHDFVRGLCAKLAQLLLQAQISMGSLLLCASRKCPNHLIALI